MAGASAAPAEPAPYDRSELERAIIEAEGAAAVLSVLEDQLTVDLEQGWKALHLTPREGLRVTTLTETEQRAFDHARGHLQDCVAAVSRVFYARQREQRS